MLHTHVLANQGLLSVMDIMLQHLDHKTIILPSVSRELHKVAFPQDDHMLLLMAAWFQTCHQLLCQFHDVRVGERDCEGLQKPG